MNSFRPGVLERQPITHGLLKTVRGLGEFKGKEGLYLQQIPQALETLRQAAIIQSTESSNRIEGVTAPPKRLRALMAQKTTPRDRSEQEIAGYRDVLDTIHAHHADIPFAPGVVLQFHRDLFGYSEGGGGRWKSSDNTITETWPDGTRVVRFEPTPAYATPDAMDQLHRALNARWAEEEIEPLLLIPAYVLDFLCIHPFLDGNGRMARLLSLLLLYRAGFGVGRYISLERIIETSKESYYEALQRSSQGWHEGRHDLAPWTDYFLGVLIAAYREFESRVGAVSTDRGTKTPMVLDAIRSMRGEFTARDIQNRCPHVSIDMIRKILQKERKAGRVDGTGPGSNSRWWRTDMI